MYVQQFSITSKKDGMNSFVELKDNDMQWKVRSIYDVFIIVFLSTISRGAKGGGDWGSR